MPAVDLADIKLLQLTAQAPDHHLDKSLTGELQALLDAGTPSTEDVSAWVGKARDFSVRYALASGFGMNILAILAEKYPESTEDRDKRRAEVEAAGG